MKAIAGCLLVCATGCTLITDSFDTNGFSGDPFPIKLETSSGAVIVGLRDGATDHVAVIDTLSPITLIDPGIDASPTVNDKDLIVLGERTTGVLDLPRAQLTSARVLSLHPCDDVDCFVGAVGSQRPYGAIIGADALAGDALRLRLNEDLAFILADVGGDETDRATLCDAVYPSPYRGGGTLVVAGTELGFAGRRITMPTCLGFDPDEAIPQSNRGVDALMLVSTSIGSSLLGEAAYQRYRLVRGAPALDTLPVGELFLPSGRVTGRIATIDKMALVARSSSTPRAACRHVYSHHFLLERDCVEGDDCPCEDGSTFCPMPALVELAPAAGLEVLVIPDENATLQALRAELRPGQPEVDGILGTSVLRAIEMDIDYPHDRVLARCATNDCVMRTAMPQRSSRGRVQECATATL